MNPTVKAETGAARIGSLDLPPPPRIPRDASILPPARGLQPVALCEKCGERPPVADVIATWTEQTGVADFKTHVHGKGEWCQRCIDEAEADDFDVEALP